MLVGVPTGVKKIFNWLGTMYGGRIRFATPMLFCTAFLFQFLCGLTGIMLASGPLQLAAHRLLLRRRPFPFRADWCDHFQYLRGIYYCTVSEGDGRMLSEKLGRWHFWLLVIGFNLTFVTLHFAGILGMPRRIYTYPPTAAGSSGISSPPWACPARCGDPRLPGECHRLITAGHTGRRRPWDAWTLEWSTTSPPPAYNFDTISEVKSRRPLWDLKHPNDPDGLHE